VSEFRIKVRGAGGTILLEFLCDTHGRFEAHVDRETSPDSVPCPECGADSPWSPSSAPMCRVRAVEAIKGKWTKPERKTYTDTRNLGEGQPLYEWKEDRAAIWEERRKADVMKFAKEH
jgi:hypothetical protein